MSANYLKQQLRLQICQKRQTLSEDQRTVLSQKLTQQISQHPLFKQSRKIAFYISNKGEIDPKALKLEALNLGKTCYLPVLHPTQTNKLIFAKVDHNTEYTPNKYGILEPKLDTAKIVPPWHLDLIMLPLVAFDLAFNRLGMGGGYYDRTLAFKHKNQGSTTLLGLAYSFQQVSHVPHTAQDVRLDAIATEKYILKKP